MPLLLLCSPILDTLADLHVETEALQRCRSLRAANAVNE